jgi:hypothetical protein
MDPRAPQLALPSLAAHLRANSVTVTMRDLAIDGLLWLTEPSALDRTERALARESGPGASGLRPFAHAASMAEDAVEAMRDPGRFFDAREFMAAREVLGSVLAGHCAARDARLSCSLSPIRYEVAGVDLARFDALVELVRDPRANLFHDYYVERIVPALCGESPDAVGISLTNHQQWLPGLHLASTLKRHGLFVVLGGALISKFVDALATLPAFFQIFADSVVAYEGETALLALLEQLHCGRRFDRVPNHLFLDRGSVRVTAPRVEDVNALPTPDFDGLPLDLYLTPHPVLPILMGKGCYFNRCRFCEIPFINHVSTRSYRLRQPELVVQDVLELERKHQAKHFVITDEALSPGLLVKLAQAFAQQPARERHFTGYARLDSGFTREVFATIAEMGMRKLFFGMESASQRMIDHMDKATRTAAVPGILRDCRDAGIRFHLFSIIGFPEETESMARETYQFFSDQAEVLDVPGNTFGVRRFYLELRARYFLDRDQFGIVMAPDALEPEFLVGLGPEQWTNTRGMTREDVDRLLEEFNTGLVRRFPGIFGNHFLVWPAGEEHAVLYCGHYVGGRRDFPYRASLPERDSSLRITLRINPAIGSRLDGDAVWLSTPGHSIMLPRDLVEAATRGHPRSVTELLAELGAENLERLDALIAAGLLQLRGTRDAAATH